MRRQRLLSARVEPHVERPVELLNDPQRGPLRRVQWSSYYHRFFGRVRPGDRLPAGFEPLSLDDSTKTLYQTCCGSDDEAAKRGRRHLARRCVSQMLLYGYRPAEHRRQEFDQVAMTAAGLDNGEKDVALDRLAAAKSKEFLVTWGEREFTPWGMLPEQRLSVQQEIAQAAQETRMISRPTQIGHAQGAFVFEKKVYLRTHVDDVKHLVNPENWEQLGEFFARTFKEGEENNPAGRNADAWQGVLREDFIVSWNGFTTNVFKQRLKVDYTVRPELARTDYALMYEEDDQIALNEGFLEVKIDADIPSDWIVGTMRKKLKFTSSMLNLLCPALLSMILDSKAGGFNNFLQDTNGRLR